MNSTVLCRLTICSCAARRRATVAGSTSSTSSSACGFGVRVQGRFGVFWVRGKETGQTRAFRRVRARRTFQKSARSLARDKNATHVAPSSQERLERRGSEIDPEERNRAWDTPRVGSRRKSDDRSAGRREVTLEATSLESRRSAVGVAIAPRSMRGRTFRFKSPPLEAIVPGTRVAWAIQRNPAIVVAHRARVSRRHARASTRGRRGSESARSPVLARV